MKTIILKLTHKIWNKTISRILNEACQKSIISSKQFHDLAAMFDPTQKHKVY